MRKSHAIIYVCLALAACEAGPADPSSEGNQSRDVRPAEQPLVQATATKSPPSMNVENALGSRLKLRLSSEASVMSSAAATVLGPSSITQAGYYRWGVNLSNAASGVYYAHITSSNGLLDDVVEFVHPPGNGWAPEVYIGHTTGNFTVNATVYNIGEQPVAYASPLSVSVNIPAPPSISSISTSPSQPIQYNPFTLTINGSGFDTTTAEVVLTMVSPSCPPNTSCESVLGDGYITSRTSTQIVLGMTLGTAGTYEVQVRNGSEGSRSNAASFTVSPMY